MLHNTHLIKINDSQTAKNKENPNQVIEDEFLTSQLSKRSKLKAHYSSLLNQKEREINRSNNQMLITNRNKRPISSMFSQFSFRIDQKKIAQTPLSKSPSQILDLSSQKELRPSSSYSTLYPSESLVSPNLDMFTTNSRPITSNKRSNSKIFSSNRLTQSPTYNYSFNIKNSLMKNSSCNMSNKPKREVNFKKGILGKKIY